jgi:polyribonucleotide nucleotidyltransferase
MENMTQVICNGTMQAAAQIIASKAIQIDTDQLTDALKAQVKAQYSETMNELKAALDCNMPESMLRQILNVSCNKMAIDAIKSCGGLQ